MPIATPIRLSPAARARLAALVANYGVNGAARMTGLSRHAVTALLSGAPVHAWTVALAEPRLVAMAEGTR